MNRRHASSTRLSALKAALRKAKPDDMITLDGLVKLWGQSKGNFVKVRDLTPDFPVHTKGPMGIMIYPARAALTALLNEEQREYREAENIAKRQAKLIGHVSTGGKAATPETFIPIEQQAKISRLQGEMEERQRAQGEYIPVAEVQRIIGNVFSMISGVLSTLETVVDPNGSLPLPQRELIHQSGRQTLLKVNAELKDMLNGNASPRRRRATKAGRPRGRAR